MLRTRRRASTRVSRTSEFSSFHKSRKKCHCNCRWPARMASDERNEAEGLVMLCLNGFIYLEQPPAHKGRALACAETPILDRNSHLLLKPMPISLLFDAR